MSYPDFFEADARLYVLQALAGQANGQLNADHIGHGLDAKGYHRSRDWLVTQLRKMEDVGAIAVADSEGGSVVAKLAKAGLDHVERRSFVEGISRPSAAN